MKVTNNKDQVRECLFTLAGICMPTKGSIFWEKVLVSSRTVCVMDEAAWVQVLSFFNIRLHTYVKLMWMKIFFLLQRVRKTLHPLFIFRTSGFLRRWSVQRFADYWFRNCSVLLLTMIAGVDRPSLPCFYSSNFLPSILLALLLPSFILFT